MPTPASDSGGALLPVGAATSAPPKGTALGSCAPLEASDSHVLACDLPSDLALVGAYGSTLVALGQSSPADGTLYVLALHRENGQVRALASLGTMPEEPSRESRNYLSSFVLRDGALYFFDVEHGAGNELQELNIVTGARTSVTSWGAGPFASFGLWAKNAVFDNWGPSSAPALWKVPFLGGYADAESVGDSELRLVATTDNVIVLDRCWVSSSAGPTLGSFARMLMVSPWQTGTPTWCTDTAMLLSDATFDNAWAYYPTITPSCTRIARGPHISPFGMAANVVSTCLNERPKTLRVTPDRAFVYWNIDQGLARVRVTSQAEPPEEVLHLALSSPPIFDDAFVYASLSLASRGVVARITK